MEKERKVKVLSLIALVVAILGLTVAFAALSENLTIKGTAKVDAATWDVHFENFNKEGKSWFEHDENPMTVGAATIEKESISLDGTSITGLNATITKPNDMVGYAFSIKNNGTINAKVSSIVISKLCESTSSPAESCDWDGDGSVNETDVQKVNDNISFVIYKIVDNQPKEIKKDDVLNAGDQIDAIIYVYYGKMTFDNSTGSPKTEESTELPKKDLVFNDLSITINYVQAD